MARPIPEAAPVTMAALPATLPLVLMAGLVLFDYGEYQDIEVGLDFEPEPGLADNGDLESDLQDLFEVVGRAAKAAGACVALFVDELQYVNQEELAALIIALHGISQRQLPVTMVGAGLPQVRGRMGKAKSYAERLFEFPEIGALSDEHARLAIAKPAADEGVAIDEDALDAIVARTQRSTYGTPPNAPRSRPRSSIRPPNARSRRSMRVSSWSGSIGSLPRRSDTCERCPSSGPARIAPERSRGNWAPW